MKTSVKKQIIERITGCSWCKNATQEGDDGFRYFCKKKARLKWAIESCGEFTPDEQKRLDIISGKY